MVAIRERATTFVSKCAEAGQKSVDVYVRRSNRELYKHITHTKPSHPPVPAPLLRPRLRDPFHVQPRWSQITQQTPRLRNHA